MLWRLPGGRQFGDKSEQTAQQLAEESFPNSYFKVFNIVLEVPWGRVSALEVFRKRWIDKNSSLEDPWQGDESERRAQQPPEYRPLESSSFHYLVLRIEN